VRGGRYETRKEFRGLAQKGVRGVRGEHADVVAINDCGKRTIGWRAAEVRLACAEHDALFP
jgi:hypothetical protein